ncbi:sulfatase family protein [Thalassotalea sp. PLHSN55]|uniref:sulfatase family protein n=1 Tax=Thalassotalea sp. PLHSN55 TaxID=3435888 RepID=UPI003F878FE9
MKFNHALKNICLLSSLLVSTYSMSATTNVKKAVNLALEPKSQVETKLSKINRDINKPNIIWLVLEDISLDLAVYGEQKVKTPNLDRLANQGIRYNKAFATAAVCSTSRSAFFTGMHATSIGAHHHRSHISDNYQLPAHVKLMSDYMRNAGYVNLLMGPKQKTDFNFDHQGPVFDAQDGEIKYSGGAYTHAPIDINLLTRPAWQKYRSEFSGKPFFAQINYSETHRTFISDKQNPVDPATVNLPSYYADHDITRRDWALYLETVQTVDQKVGKLMADLAHAGALENTIIFIFGDHGRAMLRDKQWLYDGGIEVPLIVWGQGIAKGKVSDQLISLIDIMPTSMNLAGIAVPDYIEGKVFLGKNSESRDYIYAHKDRCDETDDRVRAVRDQQFKYIRNFWPEKPYTDFNTYKKLQYPVFTLMHKLHQQGKLTPEQASFYANTRPAEELYDTVNDPDEVHNLATNAQYKNVLTKMRQQLAHWQKSTGDQGMLPEDEKVKNDWDNFYQQHYQKQMASRGLSPQVDDDTYLAWWHTFLLNLGK